MMIAEFLIGYFKVLSGGCYTPSIPDYNLPKNCISYVNTQTNLSNKTVILDAGHMGVTYDPGCLSLIEGINEADCNYKITCLVKQRLQEKGVNVIITRNSIDTKLSLNDRIRLANANTSNMYVSIHCNNTDNNETSANGSLIIVNKNNNSVSKQYATTILNSMCESTKMVNRGIVEEDFYIRHINTPSMIIETGFMNNRHDLDMIVNHTEIIADGIANGIIEVLENTL